MAARLATLKRRATAAGVPTIYINDNFGQWRSDFRKTVAHCTSRSLAGPARVAASETDRRATTSCLKPKHSGFFDTTLDTLLETLRIRRVILTGIAGNICVLFTANDAYMRDLKIFAPADCIVSIPRPITTTRCAIDRAQGASSAAHPSSGRRPIPTSNGQFHAA